MKHGHTRVWSRFIVVCGLLAFSGAAFSRCHESSRTTGSWLVNYDGTIGEKDRIRMTLVISSGDVEGVYFYATQLMDIRLKGRLCDGFDLALDELDSEGKVAATFKGRFVDIDPKGKFGNGELQCEVIVGSWQKTGNKDEWPVYLSMESVTSGTLARRYAVAGAEDDDLIHRNALRFRTAVKNKDKEIVAALIEYPIKISLKDGARIICGPSEFVSNYDEIFSDRYRDAIVKAIPRNMFVRYDGIMLGDGQVWFGPNGKAIALNCFQAHLLDPADVGADAPPGSTASWQEKSENEISAGNDLFEFSNDWKKSS